MFLIEMSLFVIVLFMGYLDQIKNIPFGRKCMFLLYTIFALYANVIFSSFLLIAFLIGYGILSYRFEVMDARICERRLFAHPFTDATNKYKEWR